MSAATPARLDANLANAQLSTGPRTEDGKKRSSQNAVQHAIFAKTIPERDRQTFLRLLDQHQQDLCPKGAIEQQFVETIADAQWRLSRCRELQDSLLFAEIETPEQQLDALNKYSLYEQRLTRILQSSLKQLREVQASRQQREEQEMYDAARISRSLAAKGTTYDPGSDGFVFSARDLAAWMQRNDRLDLAIRERVATWAAGGLALKASR